MKIAIDISPIVYGTGVSVYTKNLIENLLKIDKENEYVLFGGSLRRYGELKKLLYHYHTTRLQRICASISGTAVYGNCATKVYLVPPLLADVVWNRLHIFKVENLVGKIDVFHSSDWTQPPTKAFKVTTVHDLVPIK